MVFIGCSVMLDSGTRQAFKKKATRPKKTHTKNKGRAANITHGFVARITSLEYDASEND